MEWTGSLASPKRALRVPSVSITCLHPGALTSVGVPRALNVERQSALTRLRCELNWGSQHTLVFVRPARSTRSDTGGHAFRALGARLAVADRAGEARFICDRTGSSYLVFVIPPYSVLGAACLRQFPELLDARPGWANVTHPPLARPALGSSTDAASTALDTTPLRCVRVGTRCGEMIGLFIRDGSRSGQPDMSRDIPMLPVFAPTRAPRPTSPAIRCPPVFKRMSHHNGLRSREIGGRPVKASRTFHHSIRLSVIHQCLVTPRVLMLFMRSDHGHRDLPDAIYAPTSACNSELLGDHLCRRLSVSTLGQQRRM